MKLFKNRRVQIEDKYCLCDIPEMLFSFLINFSGELTKRMRFQIVLVLLLTKSFLVHSRRAFVLLFHT